MSSLAALFSNSFGSPFLSLSRLFSTADWSQFRLVARNNQIAAGKNTSKHYTLQAAWSSFETYSVSSNMLKGMTGTYLQRKPLFTSSMPCQCWPSWLGCTGCIRVKLVYYFVAKRHSRMDLNWFSIAPRTRSNRFESSHGRQLRWMRYSCVFDTLHSGSKRVTNQP